MTSSAHQPDSAGASSRAKLTTQGGSTPAFRTPHSALKSVLLLLPIGYLWFTLINQLRPEWSGNPQYSYGWVVPILCLGLLWRKWHGAKDQGPGVNGQSSVVSSPVVTGPWSMAYGPVLLFALCALFFLPTRMLQAADPAWRLVDWLLAVDVIGLTLCGLCLAGGSAWLRRYAFPICFFLVAVPWLYPIEKWLVAQLTFGVSAATVEVLGILGLPAVAHGKVIEVGTGVVGLDEACSGIRSFQSSLMISLFLGAYYGLPGWRRVLLVPVGFVLSFLFNVCRTSILTWIAARKGIAAIAGHHDQAGVTILLACTISMWFLALLMRKQGATIEVPAEAARPGSPPPQPSTLSSLAVPSSSGPPPTVNGPSSDSQPSTLNSQPSQASSPVVRSQWSVVRLVALGLLAWLALVEAGVAVWSRRGAAVTANAARWSIAWPTENTTFKQIESTGDALKLLQYDEAQQGQWSEADGTTWSAIYFNWLPGRVGAYLAANRHSPEICMTYAGWEMRSGPDRALVQVKNLHLPFRRYSFAQGAKTLHVFHCRWEPAFETNPALLQQQGLGTTLRGFRGLSVLWSARGKGGQKILEVIVEGCETADQAQAALVRQLEKLIKVENNGTDPRTADRRTRGQRVRTLGSWPRFRCPVARHSRPAPCGPELSAFSFQLSSLGSQSLIFCSVLPTFCFV